MKCAFLLALLASVACLAFASKVARNEKQSPMSQVVKLIIELKAKVEADGMSEQKSYDKFACWCEKTLQRKAKDIADAKVKIQELQLEINKLSGDLGTHGAEIEQLKKDIAENLEAQREATELRAKENEEYEAEKTESEQCIGALEAAVKVLTGAGTKKGFLQTLQEAQVISVAQGLREFVEKPQVQSQVSATDLAAVRDFIARPESYIHSGDSQLQIEEMGMAARRGKALAGFIQNPFGDYAPQSTQITGILKGMYDSFTESLEKANVEEAQNQKSFEELMATKKEELATLEAALAKETGDEAAKTKRIADARQDRDDTMAQLKADEKFFAETKDSCQEKASEWSNRTRLRTLELHGIAKAIAILNSPEAQRTFTNARNTLLLQVSSGDDAPKTRAKAYSRLRDLASKYASLGLAQVAAALKTGGQFDEVIVMIDKMIALLRQEGKEDVEHRDRCQTGVEKNKHDKEDFIFDKNNAEQEREVLQDKADKVQSELHGVESDIESTKKGMADRLELRNGEEAAFKQALKEDVDAVQILGKAIEALTKFYSENKLPIALVQQGEPEYTIDKDKAPETSWQGGDYGGTSSETGGIISILGMLKEDFEREIKTGRAEDAEAEKKYEEDKKAMQETLDAQMERKIGLEKELADLDMKINQITAFIDGKDADLSQAKTMGDALSDDCAWVGTHFESRKDKREKEIAGLMEAKTILGGAEDGAVFGGLEEDLS